MNNGLTAQMQLQVVVIGGVKRTIGEHMFDLTVRLAGLDIDGVVDGGPPLTTVAAARARDARAILAAIKVSTS